MSWALVFAGVYNLVWGAVVILFPGALFRWAGMELPRYPQIWQCVGMIVGVYGIGYLAAARDPYRHWPVVLVGLLGKVLGPIGFFSSAIRGELPWAWGATILTNDLIWWVPFVAILYHAGRHHANTAPGDCPINLDSVVNEVESQRGATLAELSARGPVLVVFLRHAGCPFCRQTLTMLAAQRARIESCGVTIGLVHMSPLMHATQMLLRYGLDDLHRFRDADCRLYRAFGLKRAGLGHLFGPANWWPALRAAVVEGHGVGPPVGDVFRMHGTFLLHQGRVIAAFRPQHAAEQHDLLQVACGKNSPCVDRDVDGTLAIL